MGPAEYNAAMEPLFALMQENVLNRQTWVKREKLGSAIVVRIEKNATGQDIQARWAFWRL